VDRIIHSAVFYPANYGFIPQDVMRRYDLARRPVLLARAGTFCHWRSSKRGHWIDDVIDSGASDARSSPWPTNDPEFNSYVEANDCRRIALVCGMNP